MSKILRPYQQQCIDTLSHMSAALVYMPVGAGKTVITLTAMQQALREGAIDRWLIVAPPRVAEHVWMQEASKWSHLNGLKIVRYLGAPMVRKDNLKLKHNVLVTHFSFLEEVLRIVSEHPQLKWGLIIDELACVSHSGTKRFKALTDLENEYGEDVFRKRWGLTATPVSNKLEDIFPQARVIEGGYRLTRFKQVFLREFFYPIEFGFQGKVSKWAPKQGAYDAICERLGDVMITIPDSLYRAQLPDVMHNDVTVSMPAKTREAYIDLAQGFLKLELKRIEVDGALQKMEQLTAGFAYDDKHKAFTFDTEKVDAVKELVDGLQGAKAVIVYRFTATLEALLKAIPNSEDFRSEGAFDRFKEGNTQVLLIHPESAGHGVDGMQYVCNNMIWVQHPWSARQWEQTIGRLARSGQEKPVFVHTLITEESVDEVLKKVLTSKLDVAKVFLEHIKEMASI